MPQVTTVGSPAAETELFRLMLSPAIAEDPEAFVMAAFPWGKVGTPLEYSTGPRKWQRTALRKMAERIRQNKDALSLDLFPEVLRMAKASGRGPGKSAFLAWVILWMMSCHIGSTTIVTANTEAQLKTKTWAELGKWHTLSINSHWFERQALSLKPAPWFDELVKRQLKIDTGYYYASAQIWSEENPDAFAGAHNPHGMLIVFDEASGIPQPIWTVTEGFFTEPVLHRYWFAFGNPRRNTGAFFDCFNLNRDLWDGENIDSRSIEGVDLNVLNSIIKQYGEDSDEAKVEVLGQFPAHGEKQFISREYIDAAVERQIEYDDFAPLIMGVDVARFGSDKSVVRFRRGRDARTIPPSKFKRLDNMQLALEVAALIDKHQPDAVCIDGGAGAGVIDRLRELKYKVHEVWFGTKSPEPEWGNFGTYMWAKLRDWLRGAMIDDDRHLKDDMANREYRFVGTSDVQRLESKEEMRKPPRSLPSPDDADALALTFAVRVSRKDARTSRHNNNERMAKDIDYPMYG